MGIQENVFEDLPSREGDPSEFFENSTNLASSSRRLGNDSTGNFTEREWERKVRQEPLNSSLPLPCFQREAGVRNHAGGICSHNGMIKISSPGNAFWKIPRPYGISDV